MSHFNIPFSKLRDVKGFTLVELMIVIAIIGILAAVALTQFTAYRQKSKASKLTDLSRSCAMEQVSFCQNNATPVGATLQNLPNCQQLSSGTLQLPSGDVVNTATVSNTCTPITIVAGATIDGRPYTSTCQGAYNNNLICQLR